MNSTDRDDLLARALRRTRQAFIAVGLFSLVLNLLYLVSPLYMLQVYDRVLASGRYETLLYLTVIAIVALIALGLLDGLRMALLSRIGTWLQTRLGPEVLAAGIRASRTANGQGAQPLRDLQTLQGFVGSPAITPFFDAPWTPIFVAIVWLLHPWLGVFTLAVAVLLFALAVVNDVMTRRLYAEGAENGMRVMRDAEQFHAHSETVQALGMLESLQARWRDRHAEGQRQLSRTSETSSWISSLTRFIRLAAQVGVLGIGAYLVLEAQLSTGGMIAASILLGRAVAPVEQSTSAWRGFSSARLALRRLRALLDVHASPAEPMRLPEPKGHLSVESLTIRAPGSARLILNAVSLAVRPGELVAIVGPSASGKSTLCRTVVGVVTPSAGVVRLDGADVATWPRNQLGRAVGYLPQTVELFDGTVRENIARMGDSDPDEVVAAARMADVHDMILRLPAGYETRIGPGGELLSGGQRQRLALARALFRDPKLIVLDEPNANLDQAGELALLTALRGAKARGAAVLLVAHGQHVLSAADKILVLVNGAIDLFDTRDDVIKIMQERQRFAAAQASKITTASETG